MVLLLFMRFWLILFCFFLGGGAGLLSQLHEESFCAFILCWPNSWAMAKRGGKTCFHTSVKTRTWETMAYRSICVSEIWNVFLFTVKHAKNRELFRELCTIKRGHDPNQTVPHICHKAVCSLKCYHWIHHWPGPLITGFWTRLPMDPCVPRGLY